MVNFTEIFMINTVTDGAIGLLRSIVSLQLCCVLSNVSPYLKHASSLSLMPINFTLQGLFKPQNSYPAPPPIIIKMPLWELAQEAGPFVRLAGLSGAAAVVLGAMGAHRTFPEPETKEDLRKIFDTANRFHFLHTLALVTVPLCRRPAIVSINLCHLTLYKYYLLPLHNMYDGL